MKAVLPKHVQACQHSPLPALMRWFIYTWRRDSPAVQTRVPYSCNSWRCPTCSRHEAAVTFARIREAVLTVNEPGWCFLVLTLDRNGVRTGKALSDVNSAYRTLGKMCRATLDRVGRLWGAHEKLERSGRSKTLRTVRSVGNRWFAVVEAHRSGWPHLNLVVWCPELAERLRAEHAQRLEDPQLADAVEAARAAWRRGEKPGAELRAQARRAITVSDDVLEVLHDSGWGYQSTAEAARDIDAVISYGVKLAGLHDASVGELAKITQAPLNAPVRFRRLRAGKGFLPPRRSNPDVTGCMVRRRRSREGDWEIQAINAPKDPAQTEPVERAARAELQLIEQEERVLASGCTLKSLPTIRSVVHGQLQTGQRIGALQQRASAIADSLERTAAGEFGDGAAVATAELRGRRRWRMLHTA